MEIPEHNKIENNSPTNESHNFSLYLSGYIEMQRRVQAVRKKKVPSIFNSFRSMPTSLLEIALTCHTLLFFIS